jgi:hypothetical protein
VSKLREEEGPQEVSDPRTTNSPERGRGDPTSTMFWSPRKHAGQKKPSEANEEEAVEDEAEQGAQDGEEL